MVKPAPDIGFELGPLEHRSPCICAAFVTAPLGSPYGSRVFELELVVPSSYPFKGPQVSFKTPVFHPSVNVDGIIADGLRADWSPTFTIGELLRGVQVLLSHPVECFHSGLGVAHISDHPGLPGGIEAVINADSRFSSIEMWADSPAGLCAVAAAYAEQHATLSTAQPLPTVANFPVGAPCLAEINALYCLLEDTPIADVKHKGNMQTVPLHHMPAGGSATTVWVKTVTGETLQFTLPEDATVGELKDAISASERMPSDQIALIFAGRSLQSERSLLDYNIIDQSTVHMLLRLSYPKPLMDAIENIHKYYASLRRFIVGEKCHPQCIAAKLVITAKLISSLVGAGRARPVANSEAATLLKVATVIPYPIAAKIFQLVVLAQWSEQAKLNTKWTTRFGAVPVYTTHGSALHNMYGVHLDFLL